MASVGTIRVGTVCTVTPPGEVWATKVGGKTAKERQFVSGKKLLVAMHLLLVVMPLSLQCGFISHVQMCACAVAATARSKKSTDKEHLNGPEAFVSQVAFGEFFRRPDLDSSPCPPPFS